MNKLIMLAGLPSSGKSTYAQEISTKENAVIHSSDDLRIELFGNVNDTEHNQELFAELYERIKYDLQDGRNVCFDATNISYKRRKAFLERIKKYNCIKECHLMATPYNMCVEWNEQREKSVPEHVIKEMHLVFDVPAYFEGWDNIKIIRNGNIGETYQELFERLNKINQDNPNHSLTIGMHCKSCMAHVATCLFINNIIDFSLIVAALFHDIGKEFTKSFKNGKGEITKEAHYHNHHHVSAYNTLFYLNQAKYNVLDICQLIRWHMQPFFTKTEKAKIRFINLVGLDFYKRLLILHEADKLAH